jgi:hypothetical protein
MRAGAFTGSIAAALATVVVTAAPAQAETGSFSNTTDITFDEVGPATPYPSSVNAAGLNGTISKVTVLLDSLQKSIPDDVDAVLVGPGGQTVLLMSDAGGNVSPINADLTFDDSSPNSLPDNNMLVTGTYRPTDFEPADFLDPPAPAPPYGATLSVFNRTPPSGTWSLFAFDDTNGVSSGSIDGWTLNLVTILPTIDLTATRQKLKKRAAFTATSNVDGKLAISGGVKPLTVDLKANQGTPLADKLKKSVLRRLLDALEEGRKAKVNILGTFTDISGTTTSDPVKVKFKR